MFSLAYALHRIYGNKLCLIYLLALWIGITRIYVGAHFPIDVLGGAIVGLASSFIGLWFFKKLSFRFQIFLN